MRRLVIYQFFDGDNVVASSKLSRLDNCIQVIQLKVSPKSCRATLQVEK